LVKSGPVWDSIRATNENFLFSWQDKYNWVSVAALKRPAAKS